MASNAKKKEWSEMTRGEKTLGLSIVLILVCLAIWGVTAAASGLSHSSHLSTADTSDDTASTPTSTSTDSPAPTSAPTPSNSIAAWNSTYGSTLTTLSSDMDAFGKDAQALNYSAVTSDCQKMNSDATADLSLPTIPDTNAAAHYASGLTYTQQAAQQCITGMNDVSNGDDADATTQILTANTDITSAGTQFSDAADAINQALGN